MWDAWYKCDGCGQGKECYAFLRGLNNGETINGDCISGDSGLANWQLSGPPNSGNAESENTSTYTGNTPVVPLDIGCPCVGCQPETKKCRKCVADHQRT